MAKSEQFALEVENVEKIFLSCLGEKGLDLVEEGRTNNRKKLSYLRNFVSLHSSSGELNGLDFEEISFIHKSVLLCFHSNALDSPAAIHASFSQNEVRLQIIQRVLAALPPTSSARNDTLVKMYRATSGAASKRMALLLEAVFDGVISFIWEKAENLPFIKMAAGEHVPASTAEHSSFLPPLISSLDADIIDLINDWNQSSKRTKKGSLKSRWSSVLLLKIFLEGLLQGGGSKWGVGESGWAVLRLLKASNVYSARFYNRFCLVLGNFYSQFCCCSDCDRKIIGHFKDRHRKRESLCESCQTVKNKKSKGPVSVGGSEKLMLPDAFWNDFLASPFERDSTGEAKSKPKKEKESLFSWGEEEGVVPQRNKFGSRRFIENLLVRYTEEILFPIGLTKKDVQMVDSLLVFHLSELTNSESFRLPITDKPLTEDQDLLLFFDPNPSTRVALMNALLRSERYEDRRHSAKKNKPVSYQISSSLGKRLYLSSRLNHFEEQLGNLGEEDPILLEKLINYASSKDFDVAMNWDKLEENFDSRDERTKRKRLDSLARVQVVLQRYGRLVGSGSFPASDLLKHPMYKLFSSYFNKILSPDKAEVLRVYVLKTLKELGGFDCILGFLFQKKMWNWVRFDPSALEIVFEDLPIGPLISLSDRDSNLREMKILIKECIQGENLDDKKVSAILNAKHLEKLLIPALYYQISTLAATDKESGKFLKRVNDLGKSLADGLMRKKIFVFLSATLPVAVNIILLLTSRFDSSPYVRRKIVAAPTEVGQNLGNKAKVLLQLQLRILMGASANPSSWLACLLIEPGEYTERYLPGSAFAIPLQGLRWFECPNGHPYSVGECGMPLQQSRCPACGASIGGLHHRSVAGVKDARKNPMMDLVTHLGYGYVRGEYVQRIEHYTVSFIRLIVHTCLFMSLVLPNGSPEGVSKLFRHPNDEKLRDTMMTVVGRDFDEIIHRNRLDCLLNGVLLNATFYLLTEKASFWVQGSALTSKQPITPLEKVTNESVRHVINDLQTTIQHRIDSSWQSSQRETILQRALGQQIWDELSESDLRPTQMWKYIPSVRLDHFVMSTSGIPSFEERYPLLNGFLENENRFELVQCIVPILEWHNLLFSVFQNTELTRDQAQRITNADVLSLLPTQKEQKRGQRVLRNFCNAFNQAFPIVDLIFECNKNLFLTEDGEVDLKMTGSPNPMTPATPIFFSLPNATKVGKEIDAQAHCTVQLLIYLHRIHEGALAVGGEPNITAVISNNTATHALRQKLIFYTRQQDLIPLLTTFSSPSESSSLQYDFLAIENSLRARVFGGIQRTRLDIKHYQYKGDVRAAVGGMGEIHSQISQVPVSEFIMHLIFTEVNTRACVIALMSKIKIVLQFISTLRKSSVKRLELEKILLRDYATEVLQILPEDWDEVSPPSVNEHIRLCHLQDLEEKLGVHHEISSNYTEGLVAAHRDELQKHFAVNRGKYLHIVLPVLRDLLQTQLSGKKVENELDPHLDLKEMLELKIDDDDDYGWFDQNFPVGLFEVRHSQAVFDFLSSH